MGHRIIEQPNGKFAIWSTIIDNFIKLNLTEKEIQDHFVSIAVEDSIRQTKLLLERHKEKSKGEIEGNWTYQIEFMNQMGHGCKELGTTN